MRRARVVLPQPAMTDPVPQLDDAPRAPGAPPAICIWIRRTVDWADEQAFLAQAPADLRPKVELWNATFTLPFHRFRQRVREIAELNHSRVDGAVVAEWDAIPEGTLVLPVDDDDWFAPDAAAVLGRELGPGAEGCYWTSRWVEVPTRAGHRVYLLRRRLLPWTPPKWVLTTNNYALRRTESAHALLDSHVKASRWLAAGGGPLPRIERSLSLANRTLASRTTLRYELPAISRRALLRKFHRYRTLYDRPPPPDLAWSRPYLSAMSELMRELELR
jgi:hypothetical protein